MVDIRKINTLLSKHFSIRGSSTVDPVTGIVDVDGDVTIKAIQVTQIPVQFGHVTGTFACWKNSLTTLKGSPHHARDFICEQNELTSLVYAPKTVTGKMRCGYNKLTSLDHTPQGVTSFECPHNLLTSLKGGPLQVSEIYNCSNNRLTSLEGAPTDVGYEFNCSGNKLTSLRDGPHHVGAQAGPFGGHYLCAHNQLTSLEGAPSSVPGNFVCHENPLRTLAHAPDSVGKVITLSYGADLPLLRLLNYHRFTIVDAPDELLEIMSKYAGQGKKASIACAAELAKKGFKQNAKW